MINYEVISNLTGEKLGSFKCKPTEIHMIEEIFNRYNATVQEVL